jgi:hypothetical protein
MATKRTPLGRNDGCDRVAEMSREKIKIEK